MDRTVAIKQVNDARENHSIVPVDVGAKFHPSKDDGGPVLTPTDCIFFFVLSWYLNQRLFLSVQAIFIPRIHQKRKNNMVVNFLMSCHLFDGKKMNPKKKRQPRHCQTLKLCLRCYLLVATT